MKQFRQSSFHHWDRRRWEMIYKAVRFPECVPNMITSAKKIRLCRFAHIFIARKWNRLFITGQELLLAFVTCINKCPRLLCGYHRYGLGLVPKQYSALQYWNSMSNDGAGELWGLFERWDNELWNFWREWFCKGPVQTWVSLWILWCSYEGRYNHDAAGRALYYEGVFVIACRSLRNSDV